MQIIIYITLFDVRMLRQKRDGYQLKVEICVLYISKRHDFKYTVYYHNYIVYSKNKLE